MHDYFRARTRARIRSRDGALARNYFNVNTFLMGQPCHPPGHLFTKQCKCNIPNNTHLSDQPVTTRGYIMNDEHIGTNSAAPEEPEGTSNANPMYSSTPEKTNNHPLGAQQTFINAANLESKKELLDLAEFNVKLDALEQKIVGLSPQENSSTKNNLTKIYDELNKLRSEFLMINSPMTPEEFFQKCATALEAALNKN